MKTLGLKSKQKKLIDKIMPVCDSDAPAIRKMKKTMSDDLLPRYDGLREYLQETSLLDPRFKVSYLPEEDMTPVSKRVILVTASKVSIKKEPLDLPQVEKDDDIKTEVVSATSQPIQQSSVLASLLDDVVMIKAVKGNMTLTERVEDEMQKYLEADLLSLNSNPLEWWKNNTIFYPNIAALARERLAVPATSVPSVRVFSTAGDILSAQRAALSSENVDMLIFLKKNMS